MLVLTVVFGKWAKCRQGPALSVARFLRDASLAILLQRTSESGNSLVANSNLISKVYSRAVVPEQCHHQFRGFLISAVFLVALMFWYRFAPPAQIVFLPLFVLLAFAASFGVGIWIAASWSNIAISASSCHSSSNSGSMFRPSDSQQRGSRTIPPPYSLNPIVGVIDGFRWCILGGTQTSLLAGLWHSVTGVLFLVITGICISAAPNGRSRT